MRLAKAMAYGGELIDAQMCGHGDFKALIPLCPNCSESVFLREESSRTSKLGKEFVVPKHWVHFGGTEEQKVACEARVSSYTERDRQRIQSQARGQRLKLIQRWFWNLWVKHSFRGQTYEETELWEVMDISEFMLSSETGERFKQELEGKTFERLGRLVSQLPALSQENFAPILESLSGLNLSLHIKISCECVDYVHSRRNRDLLAQMWYRVISKMVCDAEPEEARTMMEAMVGATDREPYEEAFLVLCETLFMVPWASEFARLEAEGK